MSQRADALPRTFDLAVIGGGVNGCGIARDAAGRGASVVLIERGDLARGTSSASTKLIHGGLRYLEHYEFALVREALSERERLWSIAPHIIRPLRFVLPYAPGMRPRWLLRLGLFLYDHLGGRKRLAPAQSLDLTRDEAGRPLKSIYRYAFEYSDCAVDDARLVILNARDAANRGATVLTRTEAVRLHREGDAWRIAVRPAGGGASGVAEITARVVVNAAGPRVLDLLSRAQIPPPHPLRLVRGSHIVVSRLFDHDRAYFFQLADKRIFFVIPYERDFTLIGTTDRDHDGPLDDIHASAEEIAYLCAGVNGYFRTQIAPDDVIWSYAGVRPLIDDGSGKPETATRGYRLDMDAPDGQAPLLSVFGGKITTYRHLAEAVMRHLTPWLDRLGGPSWTADAALPGGDFPMGAVDALRQRLRDRYLFLDDLAAGRLARSYGTLAFEWLGEARAISDLGPAFGHGLTGAEVDYLMDREWACTADDILWRRTKLGLRFDPAERALLATYVEAQDRLSRQRTGGSEH